MLSNQSGEQSMFGSGLLFDDLTEFVFSNKRCKLILVGDTAQLPPIGLPYSPALDSTYVEQSYLKTCKSGVLSDVVRQSQESSILYNATLIRQLIDTGTITFPKFTIQHTDFVSITGSELLECLESSYAKRSGEYYNNNSQQIGKQIQPRYTTNYIMARFRNIGR